MYYEKREELPINGEGTAQVVHAGELAALVESLGYTDGSAREWGFPDIFSLAECLFARFRQNLCPMRAPVRRVDGVSSGQKQDVRCASFRSASPTQSLG